MPKSSDDKKRDEVLNRMLKTPHKPHIDKSLAKGKRKIDDKSEGTGRRSSTSKPTS
jgi:hypothetical protein